MNTYVVRNINTGETFQGFLSRTEATEKCEYLRIIRPGLWEVFAELTP